MNCKGLRTKRERFKVSDEFVAQVYILLPTLPPGSGSEADTVAGVPKVAVAVDKVMVDVEVGCANRMNYIVQAWST